MGGQTALNIAMQLSDSGVLEKHGVELIGANAASIRMAEDRELFAEAMARIGLNVPHGGIARAMDDAWKIVKVWPSIRETASEVTRPLIFQVPVSSLKVERLPA